MWRVLRVYVCFCVWGVLSLCVWSIECVGVRGRIECVYVCLCV